MDKILSPIKIRILKFLEISNITRESFYRATNISASNFKGSGLKSELGGDKIAKILACYPMLNPDWLITGRGVMLLGDTASQMPVSYTQTEERLSGNVADVTLMHDPGEEENREAIPLYQFDPAAGVADLLATTPHPAPICRIFLPGLPSCDGALRITGDAMYPLLKHGDIVFYKRAENLPDDIRWGELYLLAFKANGSEQILLRYLQQGSRPTHLRLESSSPLITPMEIPLDAIRAAALVRASVRYTTMD